MEVKSAKRITVIDCGSVKTNDIAAILAGCGCTVDIVALDDVNRHPLSAGDAVVISGGPLLFTEPGTAGTLAGKFDFIADLETACLGICLGHQAIGLQRGARVYRGAERRAEEHIRIETGHPLFEGFPKMATLCEDHCEGVELPNGFERLAWSDAYPVEAMADDGQRLYGVQFHPEVSGELGVRLLRNFTTRLCCYRV
jgi:GMP synthase-like glutamine amidotransferase